MKAIIASQRHSRAMLLLAFLLALGLAQTRAPAQSGVDLAAPARLADPDVRAHGRATYEQFCMVCHGRELEGGDGPKLVDWEWLHGGSAGEIRHTIVAGVADKGMPGFGPVLEAQALDDVVSYIISQRRGWSNADYEIRPLPGFVEPGYDYASLTAIAPAVSGTFHDRLPDFDIAEMEHHAITVTGELNVPYGYATALLATGWRPFELYAEIDGKPAAQEDFTFGSLYLLPPGKHQMRLIYATTENDRPPNQPITVTLASPRRDRFYEGLSAAGAELVNQAKFEVLASEGARIIQRRIKGLPGTLLAIGLPGGVNYAFDTRSCAIAGAWTGDFMDIGPNVNGRSNNAGKILGEWIFHEREGIRVVGDNDAHSCRYRSVDMADSSAPAIHYVADGVAMTLTGRNEGGVLELAFDAIATGDAPVALSLPTTGAPIITVAGQQVSGPVLKFTPGSDGPDLVLTISPAASENGQ